MAQTKQRTIPQRYKLAAIRQSYKNTEDRMPCTTRIRKVFFKNLPSDEPECTCYEIIGGTPNGMRVLREAGVSFDPKRYPADWREFSRKIRFERAKGRCECEGECGLHNGRDLIDPYNGRCREIDGTAGQWAKGTIMLTVAHLNRKDGPCKCAPLCAKVDHVKAMCQRCHLRYDVDLHMTNAAETRRKVKAR